MKLEEEIFESYVKTLHLWLRCLEELANWDEIAFPFEADELTRGIDHATGTLLTAMQVFPLLRGEP